MTKTVESSTERRSKAETILSAFPGAIWAENGQQIGGMDDAGPVREAAEEFPTAKYISASGTDYQVHRGHGVAFAWRLAGPFAL